MEKEFNDIFTGYENDLQKAVALVEWQKSEIESLNISLKTFSLALENLEKERHEVAIEIFARVRKAFYDVSSVTHNELTKAIRDDDQYQIDLVSGIDCVLRAVRGIIEEFAKEYTKGGEQ